MKNVCFYAYLVRAFEHRAPLLLVREPRSLFSLYDLKLTRHRPHHDKTLSSRSSLNLRECRLSDSSAGVVDAHVHRNHHY